MKKYRIIDRVEPKYGLSDIIVQEQEGLCDKIFHCWWDAKRFSYNDDKTEFPYKNRVEAIAEAKHFIEDLKAGKLEKKETVIKEIA